MTLSDPQNANASWAPSALGALSQGGSAAQPSRSATPAASATPSPDAQEERKKGYDAGYAEGLAAGQAKAQSAVTQINALLGAMAAPFEETDAVLLRELLALTERVARAVIRRELDKRVDIEQVLADALSALGSVSVPVTLILNPADAALCRDFGLVPEEHYLLKENSALARGGLQLHAGHSFVDATVESRIASALAALRAEVGLPEDDAVGPSKPTRAPSSEARDASLTFGFREEDA